MEDKEIKLHKNTIDKMSHVEMARIYRFSAIGCPYFIQQELSTYFMRRFKNFGGMTIKMSKHIGWE